MSMGRDWDRINAAQNHEKTGQVFRDLLATLPEGQREGWDIRWQEARRAERVMADYNRDYDRSLAHVSWGGQ